MGVKAWAEGLGLEEWEPVREGNGPCLYLGKMDGRRVWVKSGEVGAMSREIRALRHFQGFGAVPLVAWDDDAGWLMMGDVQATQPFDGMEDEAAIGAMVSAVQRLAEAPVPEDEWVSLGDWHLRMVREWDAGRVPYGEHALVEEARELGEWLVGTSQHERLLHGDLHHGNMLCDHRGEVWVIDPKGVLGDMAAEVGTFLRNPFPHILEEPNLTSRLRGRVEMSAALLGVDVARVRGWGVVQAVWAACWAHEDGMLADVEGGVQMARALRG